MDVGRARPTTRHKDKGNEKVKTESDQHLLRLLAWIVRRVSYVHRQDTGARHCTLPSTKRPRFGQGGPDGATVVVSSEPEVLHDAFLASVDSRAHEAGLDGGAQSFVVGRETPILHADHKSNGVDRTPEHLTTT